jgi:tRNA threonylcarbamoyl adenosine modification protein YeaZ
MWLALDTATDRAALAIGRPGDTRAADLIIGARRHASALLGSLSGLVERAGISLAGIEGVVIADGPGSFTGLRVSATVAKALIHARPMPLWVAPSLLVCARAADRVGQGEPVLAVSNALRGELFAAAYRFGPGRVEVVLAPGVYGPEAIRSAVPSPLAIVGPAAATLGAEPTWPEGRDLLDLVGLAGGVQRVDDVAAWEPVYGRPAEAQTQWELKHGRPLAHSTGRPG